MTRERFVKKMMALGWTRNEANDIAARARRYGMSYAARWEREKLCYEADQIISGPLIQAAAALDGIFEAVAIAFQTVAEAASALAVTLASFFLVEEQDGGGGHD